MKKAFTLIACLICISSHSFILSSIITSRAPGRLGDHLIAYCKATYFSLKYGIPIKQECFEHSDEFTLSLFNNGKTNDDDHPQILVESETDIMSHKDKNRIFIVDLFTSLQGDREFKHYDFFIDEVYEKMIQDPVLEQEIKKLLSPIKAFPIPQFPDQAISIAVHIRKGTGVDSPLASAQIFDTSALHKSDQNEFIEGADAGFPLKFPPEQYYIDQIKRLADIFKEQNLFVTIFTDDSDPTQLLERIKQTCNNPRIIFSLSNNDNWKQKVVEDLFMMASFDCLIRSCSHYAGVAQLLGNHKIIINPTKYEWENGCLVITETQITTRSKKTNFTEKFIVGAMITPTIVEKLHYVVNMQG